MYLESSAVVTPDPADPATYSVQDYAGMAVPWADVIRVRDGFDVLATAYRHDNGRYAVTPQGAAALMWQSWQWCLAYQLRHAGLPGAGIMTLIESGWV